MSEREFELFLKLLSRSLKLTRAQREEIADELRDHLDARLDELISEGIDRQQALRQAVDEFGDPAVLAGNFASVARFRRRRILMRVSLGSVAALTAALLVGSALWPENRAIQGPARVVGETNDTKADESVPKVSVVQVASGPVFERETFIGSLAASQKVVVRAQVGGPLTKVPFPYGATVKKGDVLFEIDPGTYPAEVVKAQAAIMGARARLERMKADLEQAKAQFQAATIMVDKLNRCRSDVDETQAELRSLEASYEIAQLNLSRTKIRAAIDGQLTAAEIDSGNLVTAGETRLATLSAVDPIMVTFLAPESAYLRLRKAVREGHLNPERIEIAIRLGDEKEFKRTGKLEGLAETQPSPNGFGLRGLLANSDHELVPGLIANVRLNLSTQPREALVIPRTAWFAKDGKPTVMVVNAQNVIEKRVVEFGFQADDLITVTAGLEQGEWIVSEPNPKYENSQPGMKVEPVRPKSP